MSYKQIKRFLVDWKWALILLCLCIAGIPLMIIYGIQSVNWGNDFWPNAFSEFLGMFVELIFGAIFTFVVIDKYTQYHKSQQWKKIKSITYKNLYFTLSNFLLKLNLSFEKGVRVESYILTEDLETLNDYLSKNDFDKFVNSLQELIDSKINENCHHEDLFTNENLEFENHQLCLSLLKFKKHSKADISSLSNLVIPKMLSFSDDIVLLDYVIELEEILTSLMLKIKSESTSVKCIWLVKLKEVLQIIENISNYIKEDINI